MELDRQVTREVVELSDFGDAKNIAVGTGRPCVYFTSVAEAGGANHGAIARIGPVKDHFRLIRVDFKEEAGTVHDIAEIRRGAARIARIVTRRLCFLGLHGRATANEGGSDENCGEIMLRVHWRPCLSEPVIWLPLNCSTQGKPVNQRCAAKATC